MSDDQTMTLFGWKVQGKCPMGCGETLFLGSAGYVTCGYLPCDNPSAPTNLLFGEPVLNLRHPAAQSVSPATPTEEGS